MRQRFTVFSRALAAGLASVTLGAQVVRGGNFYWVGGQGGSWNTTGNWSESADGGSVSNDRPTAADIAIFDASSGVSNQVAALGVDQAIQGLVFNSNAASGITISGNTLTLGNSGISILNGSGAHSINSALQLEVGSTQTWNNQGSLLTIGGTLISESASLTFTGSGATPRFSLNTLSVDGAAFTNDSGQSISQAGTISLNGDLSITGSSPFALQGAATLIGGNRKLSVSGSDHVFSGDITSDSADRTLTLDIAAASTATFSGVLKNSAATLAVSKTGAGVAVLTGANTFSGPLTIDQGTLQVLTANATSVPIIMGGTIGAAPVLSLGSGVVFRFSGVTQTADSAGGAITGAGSLGLFATRTFNVSRTSNAFGDLIISVPVTNGDTTVRSIVKDGEGRLVFQGNNTFTGATDLNSGAILLDYRVNNGNKLPDGLGINFRGASLLQSGNASAPTDETVGMIILVAGMNTIGLTSNGQPVAMTATSMSRVLGNGIINFNLPDATTTLKFNTNPLTNRFGMIGGHALVNGNRWATSAAGFISALPAAAKSDRGDWNAADHVVIDSPITGALSNNSIASLIFNSATSSTLNIDSPMNVLNVRSAALAVSPNVGNRPTTIGAGQLISEYSDAGISAEFVITNLSQGILTLDAQLGGSLSPLSTLRHLTLAGPGPIVLSGRNAFKGELNIHANVQLAGGNALPDFADVNMGGSSGATSSNIILDLNGTREAIGELTGGFGFGFGVSEVRLGNAGVLTINQLTSSTYGGLITGGADSMLIKNGNGALTLEASPQPFAGELQVLGGSIELETNTPGLTDIHTLRIRGGQVHVTQDQSFDTNKLADDVTVRLEGTAVNGLRVTNSQNASRTETAGRLQLVAGSNTISLNHASGSNANSSLTLSFDQTNSLVRQNNATMLIRGGNLGGAATGAQTHLRFADSIADLLIGGGESSGTRQSILPFAVGENSNSTGAGSTFVTYHATAGVKPLDAAGYTTLYANGTATDNVSQSATAAGLTSATFNSLRIVNTSAVTLTGAANATLNLTSGALLATAGSTTNSATLAGYSRLTAGTSAETGDELVVFVTSANSAAANATLNLNVPIQDNGGATSLTKAGAGTLVLNAANTYSGTTTINEGALQFSSAAAFNDSGMLRQASGTLRWGGVNTTDISTRSDGTPRVVEFIGPTPFLSAGGADIAYTPGTGNVLSGGAVFDIGTNNVTLANPIGNNGIGGLSKLGTGKLTLGAAPAYKGPTLVLQGEMQFPTIGAGTTSGLFVLTQNGNTSATVTNGLAVDRLVVGGSYTGTTLGNGSLTVAGGSVAIGSGNGSDLLFVGYRDGNTSGAPNGASGGAADFQAASSVNINVESMLVGYSIQFAASGNGQLRGVLNLSNSSNTINAGRIVVAHEAYSPTAVSGINLGSGQTTINADTFVVGSHRATGQVTIGSGGAVRLRGRLGDMSGTNLFIGDNDVTTGANSSGIFDLTGGVADLRINQLTIGRHHAGAGSGNGKFRFDAGTVHVATAILATPDYRGLSTQDANTTGTIEQSGGVFRFQSLSRGGGTALYTWNGGTIGNLPGVNAINDNLDITIATSSDHSFDVEPGRTLTFLPSAALRGNGGITKVGAGTLALLGANTYTGPTTISAGTLLVGGSLTGAASANDVTVGLAGTLGGGGNINLSASNGNVLVNAGGQLSPGDGAGTLTLALGTGKVDLNSAAGKSAFLLYELGETDRDRLSLTSGSLHIGNGVLDLDDFSFTNAGDFGPGSYNLIETSTPIVGSLGRNTSGQVLGHDAVLAFSADGTDLVMQVAVVPEPAGMALAATGLLRLLARRRRR